MIDSMLFLARNVQSHALVSHELVKLYDLVEQLSEYFEGVAQERDVTLISQAHDQLRADPALIRRALANLLSNTLRYGGTGTAVTVSSVVCEDRIEVTVHNQDRRFRRNIYLDCLIASTGATRHAISRTTRVSWG